MEGGGPSIILLVFIMIIDLAVGGFPVITLIKFRLVPYPDDHDYDFLTIVIVILGRVGVFTRGRSRADRFHTHTVTCLSNLVFNRTHPLIALMIKLI